LIGSTRRPRPEGQFEKMFVPATRRRIAANIAKLPDLLGRKD
jgi:hypothetical protein